VEVVLELRLDELADTLTVVDRQRVHDLRGDGDVAAYGRAGRNAGGDRLRDDAAGQRERVAERAGRGRIADEVPLPDDVFLEGVVQAVRRGEQELERRELVQLGPAERGGVQHGQRDLVVDVVLDARGRADVDGAGGPVVPIRFARAVGPLDG